MSNGIYARIQRRVAGDPVLRDLGYRILTRPGLTALLRPLQERRIARTFAAQAEFPRVVSLESTNRCNARCTMCSHQRMKRPPGFMSWDRYAAAARECAAAGVRTLLLSGFGEPLLDPELERRVAFAAGLGLRTAIVTNASRLDPDRARALIDAGLAEVNISIDGFDEPTYRRIRRGLDFATTVRNIRALAALRRDRRPVVNLEAVVLDQPRGQLARTRREWGRIVDSVIVRPAQDWLASAELGPTVPTPHRPRVRRPPCTYPFTQLVVYHDGTVPVCCLDYDAVTVVGRFPERSLREIWHGPELTAVRARHRAGRPDEIAACARCSYFPVWW